MLCRLEHGNSQVDWSKALKLVRTYSKVFNLSMNETFAHNVYLKTDDTLPHDENTCIFKFYLVSHRL